MNPHSGSLHFETALSLFEAEQYELALPLFELALERDYLTINIALCTAYRATCLRHLQRYPEALDGYDIALSLFEQDTVQETADIARCHKDRAIILGKLEQHQDALESYNHALFIYRGLKEDHAIDVAICHMDRAITYRRLQRYEDSLADYEAALEIFERESSSPTRIARCKMNRAACLRHLGRLEESLADYNEALITFEDNHASALTIARCQMNRGICLRKLGKNKRASQDYDAAMAFYRERPDLSSSLALCLVNHAVCLRHLGDYEASLSSYTEALTIYRRLNPRTISSARCRMNMALCLRNLDDFEQALKEYDLALDLLQDLGAPQTTIANCFIQRAHCRRKMGDIDQAAIDFEAAAKSLADTGSHADETRMDLQAGLTRLYQQQNELLRARHHVEQALEIAESLAGRHTDLEDRTAFRDRNSGIFRLAVSVAIRQGDEAGAFALAQRTKGRTVTELLEAHGLLATLDQEEIVLQQRHSRGEISDGEFEKESADIRTQRMRKKLALLGTSRPRMIKAISKYLYPNEALLDVVQIDEKPTLALFLLLPNSKTIAWSSQVDGHRIKDIISSYAKHMDDMSATMRLAKDQNWTYDDFVSNMAVLLPECLPLIRELGDLLFSELLPILRYHEITSLVVSPDGLFYQIPIHALMVTNESGTPEYLCDSLDLQYTPTPSALAALRHQHRSRITWPPDLLAAAPFADPDQTADAESSEESSTTAGDAETSNRPKTDPQGESPRELSTRSGTFDKLTATGHEIQSVKKMIRNLAPDCMTTLIPPEPATLEVFNHHLPSAKVVHIATHGSKLIDDDSVLDYTINLADGQAITTKDVFDHKLRLENVLMVTLSACHLGEVIQRGSEAIGFSHAFIQAGASVVTAPLWAVPDGATAQLMTLWYQELSKPDHPSIRTAWTRAIKTMRSTPAYAHPYFWAGFVPTGDASVALSPPA